MSTPTIALYYRDDYARVMDAELRAVRPDGLILDQTVFYPRGGNQDCDHGHLHTATARVAVIEVLKDEAGAILHRTDTLPADWEPGSALHGTLDWERRLTLMRLHTAQHLISRWFLDHSGNATGRVDITEAGCVIELAQAITLDMALDCMADLNALIAGGRTVRRIDTDGYLEIEVADFDRQPCGGTHVHDVGEIGRVALTRVRGNRLEIVCGAAAQAVERQTAAAVLGALGDLETDLGGFGARVAALHTEVKAGRAALFALREEVAAARVERALAAPQAASAPDGSALQLYTLDLDLIESKQVPRLLKAAQGPGRVWLVLCAGRNLVVISGSPSLPAGALVGALRARYGINGGGSPTSAQCGPLPDTVLLTSVVEQATALITTL